MKARGIKNVPITDPEGHPIGVLSARDALAVLLQDSHYQESLLRDYVMELVIVKTASSIKKSLASRQRPLSSRRCCKDFPHRKRTRTTYDGGRIFP